VKRFKKKAAVRYRKKAGPLKKRHTALQGSSLYWRGVGKRDMALRGSGGRCVLLPWGVSGERGGIHLKRPLREGHEKGFLQHEAKSSNGEKTRRGDRVRFTSLGRLGPKYRQCKGPYELGGK